MKKKFLTKEAEQLNEQLEEAIGLLQNILNWTNNHETWWINCPDKGGLDVSKIEKFINK